MKKRFKTITLSSTKQNQEILSIANQCYEVLKNKGLEILVDKNLSKLSFIGLKPSSKKTILKDSDLLIAIGGDGTMLNCAREYGSKNVCLLGINLGNLGFLNDIDPEDLTSFLTQIIEGRYVEDNRFFLEASLSTTKKTFLALNEVVIHSGEIAQLIEYDLFIDNVFVYRQKSDGLIVASPTGSTGYSLSAGGPIVHPKVSSIVLSPMLPLSLSSSSLVVKAESKICIKLASLREAQISFDSHSSIRLRKNQEINITKSKSIIKFIHPYENDFFEACRSKLGWSSRH
jgi:NAD+ kinase